MIMSVRVWKPPGLRNAECVNKLLLAVPTSHSGRTQIVYYNTLKSTGLLLLKHGRCITNEQNNTK